MDNVVSVVVPVYNAEKYLRYCIDSIVNQTYKNLEIILVDDGSTDQSGVICDDYAKIDQRVKVIHKENGGNGDSRNTGYKAATGAWLVMVDNDDLLHEQQIEILLNTALENNADVVVANYRSISDDELPEHRFITDDVYQKTKVLSEEDLNDDEFIRKRSMILTTPWSKMWKINLFQDVMFPKKSRHDDTWTTWKAYEKAKRVVFIDEILHYWRNNPESFSRVFDLSHLEGIDAYAEQLDYFIEKQKQRYVEIALAEYTEMFFWCFNRMKENHISLHHLKPYCIKMRKYLKHLKLTKTITLKQIVKYYYLAYFRIPQLINL